jgi:integrase/recombinase XerD
MGSHGKCGPGCQHLKVSKLKEPQKTLPVFDVEDIKAIIRWKAEGYYDKRLQVLLLLLVDTGARISEALGLKWSDVDFDNLLLVLHGKGSKDRKVPFSFELRRRLVKFQHNHSTYVFSTMNGTPVDRHVAARDVRKLCERLEIKRPERMLHAFRHTFSVNYVRKGGSVFHLQKALGHSSLEMSRRYANLNTQDLQDVHQRLSLLAA